VWCDFVFTRAFNCWSPRRPIFVFNIIYVVPEKLHNDEEHMTFGECLPRYERIEKDRKHVVWSRFDAIEVGTC
jgi:hypothetical protein